MTLLSPPLLRGRAKRGPYCHTAVGAGEEPSHATVLVSLAEESTSLLSPLQVCGILRAKPWCSVSWCALDPELPVFSLAEYGIPVPYSSVTKFIVKLRSRTFFFKTVKQSREAMKLSLLTCVSD